MNDKIKIKFQESLKLCFYLKDRIKKNLYQLFIPGVNLKHVFEEYFLMINKTVFLEFNGLQFLPYFLYHKIVNNLNTLKSSNLIKLDL